MFFSRFWIWITFCFMGIKLSFWAEKCPLSGTIWAKQYRKYIAPWLPNNKLLKHILHISKLDMYLFQYNQPRELSSVEPLQNLTMLSREHSGITFASTDESLKTTNASRKNREVFHETLVHNRIEHRKHAWWSMCKIMLFKHIDMLRNPSKITRYFHELSHSQLKSTPESRLCSS